MERHGVRFQAALRGTLHLSRTNAFFLGGGKALMNAYYAPRASRASTCSTTPTSCDLDLDGGAFRAATIVGGGERRVVRARAAVVATGGFESNLEWLKDAWGDAADASSCAARRTTPAAAAAAARRRRVAGGRSARLPRHRGGRARAALRRRHRHAARLHSAGYRGESRR
jgi:hypothetical protein